MGRDNVKFFLNCQVKENLGEFAVKYYVVFEIRETVMDTQLLVAFAIIAALGLVGAIAVQSIPIPQAFADPPFHGCKPGSDGFKNSGHNCRHKD